MGQQLEIALRTPGLSSLAWPCQPKSTPLANPQPEVLMRTIYPAASDPVPHTGTTSCPGQAGQAGPAPFCDFLLHHSAIAPTTSFHQQQHNSSHPSTPPTVVALPLLLPSPLAALCLAPTHPHNPSFSQHWYQVSWNAMPYPTPLLPSPAPAQSLPP